VLVASPFASPLVEIFASDCSIAVPVGLSPDVDVDVLFVCALLRDDVGTKCWMMVLLTAYLKGGWALGPDEVSEMRDLRTELMIAEFQVETLLWL